MRKAKLKVGNVIQIPVYEFAPFRRGWNGWLFQVGIIKEIGKSKKDGTPIALIEYPARDYKQTRYRLNGTEVEKTSNILTKWFRAECIMEYDISSCDYSLEHPREYWSNKCYNEDVEFLIDKGIIQYRF
jgi:hypothetical protein